MSAAVTGRAAPAGLGLDGIRRGTGRLRRRRSTHQEGMTADGDDRAATGPAARKTNGRRDFRAGGWPYAPLRGGSRCRPSLSLDLFSG